MFRAELIADVDEGEHEVLAAWLDTWRSRLDHVSVNTGCGCCVDCYNVIAPIEALNTLSTSIVNDVFPQRRPFFIAFDNNNADTAALQSFLHSLADHKRQHGNDLLVVDPLPREHSFWLNLLRASTLNRATSMNKGFGRLIDSLLSGSYDLLGVREHEIVAHFEYAPTVEAFFGGTDPLRDLVSLFGFQFVADSFIDDYNQWVGA